MKYCFDNAPAVGTYLKALSLHSVIGIIYLKHAFGFVELQFFFCWLNLNERNLPNSVEHHPAVTNNYYFLLNEHTPLSCRIIRKSVLALQVEISSFTIILLRYPYLIIYITTYDIHQLCAKKNKIKYGNQLLMIFHEIVIHAYRLTSLVNYLYYIPLYRWKKMFKNTIYCTADKLYHNLFAYVSYASSGYNNNNNDIHLSASRHRRIKGYPSACVECVCFDTGSSLLLLRFHSYITFPKPPPPPPPHVSLNRELNHRKNICTIIIIHRTRRVYYNVQYITYCSTAPISYNMYRTYTCIIYIYLYACSAGNVNCSNNVTTVIVIMLSSLVTYISILYIIHKIIVYVIIG